MTQIDAKASTLRRVGGGSAYWRAHLAEWSEPMQAGRVLLDVCEPDVGVVLVDMRGVERDFASEDFSAESNVTLFAHGDGPRIAEVLEQHYVHNPRPDFAMVSRGLSEYLSQEVLAWLPRNWGNSWDFFWTDVPLAEVPMTGEIAALSREEALDEIPAFLAQANPTSEAADDVAGYRWRVVRDATGHIASTVGVADVPMSDGMSRAYLAGLGTHPRERGHGHAAALMAAVTNIELREHDLVTFGMWGWNDTARRLYGRLGFMNGGRQVVVSDSTLQYS